MMAARVLWTSAMGWWLGRIQRRQRHGRGVRRSLRQRRTRIEPLEARVLLTAAPGFEEVAVAAGPIVPGDGPDAPLARDADENGFVVLPYLQNVDTDGIVVMWEKTDNAPMTVEFGLDESYGDAISAIAKSSGYEGTYIYRAEFSALAAGTTYHFRVLEGVDAPVTADRQFTTFTEDEIDFSFSMCACNSSRSAQPSR